MTPHPDPRAALAAARAVRTARASTRLWDLLRDEEQGEAITNALAAAGWHLSRDDERLRAALKRLVKLDDRQETRAHVWNTAYEQARAALAPAEASEVER